MKLARCLNTLWCWCCRSEGRALAQAHGDIAAAQARVLHEVLQSAADSQYGRRYGFQTIRSVRDFQQRVPIVTYDDLRPWIDAAAGGAANVLTGEPIRLFEPTSGTSGGEKLIPYTRLLQKQFQRGLRAWTGDLLTADPPLRDGRAYWSISPAAQQPRRTSGGIPIGFDHDAQYLGGIASRLMERLLVVPSGVARLQSIDNFRYATLLYLLAAADLRLISIWSPTFLTTLLAHVDRWLPSLCRDLATGKISWPQKTDSQAQALLSIRRDRLRARQLEQIFETPENRDEQLRQVWPDLRLISCWTDAAASHYVSPLQELFPQVRIQGKGLLATEGMISFPMLHLPAHALAVRSHFFEFEPRGNAGRTGAQPLTAQELIEGEQYVVLLTTGGGLYRYRLGDVVQVVGFHKQCPLIRFLGRANGTSDLVGEKLSEIHVNEVLQRLWAKYELRPRFAELIARDESPPRYCLQLETDYVTAEQVRGMRTALEAGLAQNPHYAHAVALGQLAPAEIEVLDGPLGSGDDARQQRWLAHGGKLGNLKPRTLAVRE